jgi:hypothetical protein
MIFKRELELDLAGTKLLLRGNFACIREIQSRMKKPISQIINDIMEQNLPIELFPSIIYGGLVGAGDTKGLSFDQVGDLVIQHGYTDVIKPVTRFLLMMISKDPSKIVEEKPAEGPSQAEPVEKKE